MNHTRIKTLTKLALCAAVLAGAVLTVSCSNFFHDILRRHEGDRILSFALPGQTSGALIGEHYITISP
ncbi:MAG: hypothetical protein FWD91_08175, partial [Treponema sp.]|nr:hypothetical protein [Treponema sp.]